MNKKATWGSIFGALAGIAGVIVATANRPHPPAPPPSEPPVPTYTLTVHICEGEPCDDAPTTHKAQFAAVSLDDAAISLKADGAGNATFINLPAGRYKVCAEAQGYTRGCADHRVPADGSLYLSLEPDVPPVLPVHVDGAVFRDSTGAIWQWRGVTAFTLLQKVAQGWDIGPYLDHRRAAGANLVRVLSTMKNIVDFPPTAYTDAHIGALLAAAHAHGLRVELVALADAQDWPLDAQRRQVQRIIDAVAAAGGLDFVEVANEPFKNSAPPADIMRGVQRRPGVLMASGDYDVPFGASTFWHLDYQTLHNERKDEWPRTAKDEHELRDGFDWANGASFSGVRVPVVSDEPMGADEYNVPGRRSNVADDFYWFGATAALLGAGATFHSTAGITADAPGEKQAAAERAFFAGLNSVSLDAQLGAYTRGPLPNCPLLHDDAKALRTFCSLQGGSATCVVIRPSPAWAAIAQGGWQIQSVAGPRGTVLRLSR